MARYIAELECLSRQAVWCVVFSHQQHPLSHTSLQWSRAERGGPLFNSVYKLLLADIVRNNVDFYYESRILTLFYNHLVIWKGYFSFESCLGIAT